jgi:hypothetical protein
MEVRRAEKAEGGAEVSGDEICDEGRSQKNPSLDWTKLFGRRILTLTVSRGSGCDSRWPRRGLLKR